MTPSLDLDALDPVKQRQQATWASGGYSVIETSLQIVGESLAPALGFVKVVRPRVAAGAPP